VEQQSGGPGIAQEAARAPRSGPRPAQRPEQPRRHCLPPAALTGTMRRDEQTDETEAEDDEADDE